MLKLGLTKEEHPEAFIINTQLPVMWPEFDLVGNADFSIENSITGFKRLYENKSKNAKSLEMMNKRGKGPQREHQYQLWVYMYRLGFEKGEIVYVGKDDSEITRYEVLLSDEKIKQEVIAYWTTLNDCWQKKILPPLPPMGHWSSKYCKMHKQCLREEYNLLIKNIKK